MSGNRSIRDRGVRAGNREIIRVAVISLIVATVNRVTELERLLASLETQGCASFEVILVDQNPDDRLLPVMRLHQSLSIRHLRCPPGASRARNVGLRAAGGEIIAFPDDDCWYPNNLLPAVAQWFEQNSDFEGLITGVRSPDDKLMSSTFPPRPGPVTSTSVVRCAMAVNIFLRAHVVNRIGFFREDIGPGTPSPYQSGEDLDYAIRPLEYGFRISYHPRFTVYHPPLSSKDRLRRTAYPYAVGVGHVLRLHGHPWARSLFEICVRPFAAAFLHLCRGDVRRGYASLLRAAGLIRGYVLGDKQANHP
jgi:glycosyltransferase involved in cell wall biosynthesis